MSSLLLHRAGALRAALVAVAAFVLVVAPDLAALRGDSAPAATRFEGSLGGDDLAPPEVELGGSCQPCPLFDFGCFTPTVAYQFDTQVIIGSSDCNTYCFTGITPGQ